MGCCREVAMAARFHCVETDGRRGSYEQLKVSEGDIMHIKSRTG